MLFEIKSEKPIVGLNREQNFDSLKELEAFGIAMPHELRINFMTRTITLLDRIEYENTDNRTE